MSEIDMLKQSIDAVDQAKQGYKAALEAAKSAGKGAKGAIMDMANKALKKAKAEIELKMEYTKQLVQILPKMIEKDAELMAAKLAIEPAQQTLTLAENTVHDCENQFNAAKSTYSEYRKKLTWKGEAEPSSSPEKAAVDTAKKAFQSANDALQKAKDGMKVAEDFVTAAQIASDMYHKQVAIIKMKLDPTSIITAMNQLKSKATSIASGSTIPKDSPLNDQVSDQSSDQTIDQSSDQATEASEDTIEVDGVQFTQEELDQINKEAEERQASKDAEMESLTPKYDQIDAEWMVIETGFSILQNITIPLPQVASLPAAVGMAAPNPAFNMAVSGSVGLLAMFILCEIKAAFIRWCALHDELGEEPDATKIGQVTSQLIAFTTSIPSASATGATYVSPVIANFV